MSQTTLSDKTSLFKLFKQALNGDIKDFTTGSINKAIFLLAVPMVLEMVLESVFALVDIFFVNKISSEASSTVGLQKQRLLSLYSVAWGLAMGIMALVARRTGEKNFAGASEVAAQGIIIAIHVFNSDQHCGLYFSKGNTFFYGW